MEGVQVKIDMQMIQKPGRGNRGGTLQNVFLFKTNRMKIRLRSLNFTLTGRFNSVLMHDTFVIDDVPDQ